MGKRYDRFEKTLAQNYLVRARSESNAAIARSNICYLAY